MKKLLFGVAIGLFVLLVIGVVGIGLSLNSAIKKGVEALGPKIAKVEVRLAAVKLSLFSGSGSINGLVIGNPEGYKTPHAISIGSTSISISPGSVLSDKIIVKSIRVEAPEIILEFGPGGSNLQKIQANLSSALGTSGSASPPPRPPNNPLKNSKWTKSSSAAAK